MGAVVVSFAAAGGVFVFQPTRVAAQPTEFQTLGTQAPLPVGGGGAGTAGSGRGAGAGSSSSMDATQFTTLPTGVKIKDYQLGTGDTTVPAPTHNGRSSSTTTTVSLQCSGRLLNLNGVSFYNTKNNNPDGFGALPLTFPLGQGVAVPGLEAGLVGMKKGGIRRIIVPAELAYSSFPTLQPQPMTDLDQRALDSVVKNPRRDATILFDVKLERFK